MFNICRDCLTDSNENSEKQPETKILESERTRVEQEKIHQLECAEKIQQLPQEQQEEGKRNETPPRKLLLKKALANCRKMRGTNALIWGNSFCNKFK